jgi:hypothetical protein
MGGNWICSEKFWHEYAVGKQTNAQLGHEYGISVKIVQRRLDKVYIPQQFCKPSESIVMMDTTYFGRDFVVLVFKNPAGQHLYRKFVKYETVSEYPVQMCQFHQVAIVTHYLTRKPKHQASVEFKEFVHLMS